MLHTISPSLKKCKRDTCARNNRVYAPPKRKHLTYFLKLPPHSHIKAKRIYLFASTSLRRQSTPIKRGGSHKSPALATNTSWSFTMSTATLCGQRPSRTTRGQTYPGPSTSPGANAKGGHRPETPSPRQPSISGIQEGHQQLSNMTYDLVPPDNHRRNMAEKAIQTFKDNFVGVISGCAPTFPSHLWCQLLPQVERQLLLLQQSQLYPNLSAYVHVCGHPNSTSIHSFQSGWRPLYTTNCTNVKPMQNTAKSVCSQHIHQTLLALEILVNGNLSYLTLRCRVFQAQIPG
jgi:hypothetical protein